MTPVVAKNPTYAVSVTTAERLTGAEMRGAMATSSRGGGTVVVHPDLHGLAADEVEVFEHTRGVVVPPGGVVLHGAQAVEVDADVVDVHILELRDEHGVELDGKDAVVGDVEEADRDTGRR
ncbi:hypothetical protein ZWY2020_017591 [Hordeum vulgare]|nr:hypothetical protein ZWY2020_017591 [Hordeum vulgare]